MAWELVLGSEQSGRWPTMGGELGTHAAARGLVAGRPGGAQSRGKVLHTDLIRALYRGYATCGDAFPAPRQPDPVGRDAAG